MLNPKSTIPFAAILAALAVGHGAAAKDYKLTIAGAPPAIVTPSFVAKTHFVPMLTKRAKACGDNITWNEAYGQALAKFGGTLEAVEEGIAHVGIILRNFEESKLPLEQYPSTMPFVVYDPKVLLKIDRAVRKKVPQMNKMYAKYNQIFLAGAAEHSMQLFTTFPVTKHEDLKGRKIGASGALGTYIRGTGAVQVNSSMQDSYTSIKNGLYEGYPIAIYLAFPYRTYQAAPYYTETNFGSIAVAALTINAKTWASFSPCLQKAVQQTADEWSERYVAVNSQRLGKFAGIMKKKGVKFSKLSAEERKRWAMVLPALAKEWAAALDKKGLPGTAVVKAFMEEARKHVKDIPRAWDKE